MLQIKTGKEFLRWAGWAGEVSFWGLQSADGGGGTSGSGPPAVTAPGRWVQPGRAPPASQQMKHREFCRESFAPAAEDQMFPVLTRAHEATYLKGQ